MTAVNLRLLPYQVEPPGDWHTWWYVGGRGIGKSWRGASWTVKQALKYPGTEWGAVGRTWGDAKRVCVEGRSGIKRFILTHGLEQFLLGGRWDLVSYTKSYPMELRFANGSKIHFASADNPDSLRGLNLHGVWCDEVCFWAEASWKTLRFAVREKLPDGTPPRFLCSSTPDGQNWVYDQYVEPAPVPGVVWIGGGNTPPERPPSTYDNPFLDETFQQMVIAEYEGTDWGDQELRGLFMSRRGAVFNNITRAEHTREGVCGKPDPDSDGDWLVHPWRPGFVWPTPSTVDRIVGGQDLGTVHPSVLLIGAYVGDVLCIVAEVAEAAATETEWHNAMRPTFDLWKPTVVHSESANPTVTNAQRQERGLPVRDTRKSPTSVDESIRMIQQRLRDGTLIIDHEACPLLWKELRNYRWKTDRDGNPVKPEQPVKADDDSVDALRYLALGEATRTVHVDAAAHAGDTITGDIDDIIW